VQADNSETDQSHKEHSNGPVCQNTGMWAPTPSYKGEISRHQSDERSQSYSDHSDTSFCVDGGREEAPPIREYVSSRCLSEIQVQCPFCGTFNVISNENYSGEYSGCPHV